jgi:hypothetical protein
VDLKCDGSAAVSIRPSRTSLVAPKQTGSRTAGDYADRRVTARAERVAFDFLMIFKAH